MRATTRCRIALALAPVLVPVTILVDVVYAAIDGAREFGYTLKIGLIGSWYLWYRKIYRPARYGHVDDFPPPTKPRGPHYHHANDQAILCTSETCTSGDQDFA